MSDKVTTRLLAPEDRPQLAKLHAEVFGPGRFARTAYRVRERRSEAGGVAAGLGRAAFLGNRMIASITFTDITIGDRGDAALLGPLAVHPDFNGQGYGRRLVAEAIEEAAPVGLKIVILVGDETYYGRFGFKRVPRGRIEFPGPVDPDRILAAEIELGAASLYSGPIAAV